MFPSEDIPAAFEKKLQDDPEFRKKLSEGITASLARAGLEPPPVAMVAESIRPGQRVAAAGRVITAHAYWWGYHFVIPEPAMKDFSSAGNVVTAFMTLGGSAIVASGGTLSPLVAVVAAYAAAELAVMQVVDRGKGVYLSALWPTPLFIVPTTIT